MTTVREIMTGDPRSVDTEDSVAAAAEVIETLGYEIYGSPDDETLETMRGFATRQGVPLTVRPRSLGGYLRPVVGSTGVAT